MSATPRFWRNVMLIAAAHVALIAGLIRWSVAARSTPDTESLVWVSGADDLPDGRLGSHAAALTENSIAAANSEPVPPEKSEEEQASLVQAKSEIELAKPTPTAKPAPTAPPKVKLASKPTPKPKPKPTPKRIVLAKGTKSSVHAKSSPSKSTADQSESSSEQKKSAKTATTKTKSVQNEAGGTTGSTGKSATGAGGGNASEFGWYGNMLHDRFYSAWIQPTTTIASRTKISTLVRVRIEKDGHVSKFEIIKPSENVVVNESVAAIAKKVTEVDSPPTGLIQGDHYDVKINFELNTNQEMAK